MEIVNHLKWQFYILHRNKLILISIAITATYAGVFYIFKDMGNVEGLLTILIYNDPAIIGLFFIGLSIITEKNSNVLPAIFVTPLTIDKYLITRIIALSVIGWLCALAMAVSALHLDFNIWLFSLGTFSTCAFFSLAGIVVLGNTTEFLLFMLKSIPVLLALSLPLLNYFAITDTLWLALTPLGGSLEMITASYSRKVEFQWVLLWIAHTIVWLFLGYFVAKRSFIRCLNNNL